MAGCARALQPEVLRPCGGLGDLGLVEAIAGGDAPVGRELPRYIQLQTAAALLSDGHHQVGLTRDASIVERVTLREVVGRGSYAKASAEVFALGAQLPQLTLYGVEGTSCGRVALHGDTLRLEAAQPGPVDIGARQEAVDEAYARREGTLLSTLLGALSVLDDIGEPLVAQS